MRAFDHPPQQPRVGGSPTARTSDLHAQIERRVAAGAGVEAIEAELAARARALSDEHRAALWLYAWHVSRSTAGAAESGGVFCGRRPVERGVGRLHAV